jgi:hypothetical protein
MSGKHATSAHDTLRCVDSLTPIHRVILGALTAAIAAVHKSWTPPTSLSGRRSRRRPVKAHAIPSRAPGFWQAGASWLLIRSRGAQPLDRRPNSAMSDIAPSFWRRTPLTLGARKSEAQNRAFRRRTVLWCPAWIRPEPAHPTEAHLPEGSHREAARMGTLPAEGLDPLSDEAGSTAAPRGTAAPDRH